MISRVVLLAGHTVRSRAYAQALAAAGIELAAVVIYGLPVAPAAVCTAANARSSVALPDPTISLDETCARARWPVHHLPEGDLDAPALQALLAAQRPSLVIFSGYAGQIVGSRLLGMGTPFLHVHPGWLPDYRGSTTVYYSILEQHGCAASAFLLEKGIDTGPVLMRRRYPLPSLGMDVDGLYDPAIRADLLIRVLHDMRAAAAQAQPQDMHAGHTYFVIHPVLKHLALLSLPVDGTPPDAVRREQDPHSSGVAA
ncbi:MAG: hypothetical protein KIS79_02110 [Burkholderiales bacterium]|nr:hypothetical protein [Burkholderiales bacterium]